MPTVRKGIKTNTFKTYETDVPCGSCGKMISSLVTNCPHCGATRKVSYKSTEHSGPKRELNSEETNRVKSGAQPCGFCGTLTFNYDAQKSKYVCKQCGGNDERKVTSYELAGGEPEKPGHSAPIPSRYSKSEMPTTLAEKAKSLSLPIKIGIGVLAFFVVFGCAWLISALTTTHEVPGQVTYVGWEIKAHSEVKLLKNGEGWNPPLEYTPISSSSEISGYQDNIIGYEHGTYSQLSTPEQTGHSHGDDIAIETPGAITYSLPYDCGPPTEEAGGSVTYEQCVDETQEDSTYGYVESPETPEYAPQVMVELTTEPTPIYGTPTPIYRMYYYYTFWEWDVFGQPLITSGLDNYPVTPTGQVDDTHRVIQDSQFYRVVVTYDNGKTETYEGSDPALLQRYLLGESVIGWFNALNGFNHDNQ